jgi:two-component system, LytTR family, response regulator
VRSQMARLAADHRGGSRRFMVRSAGRVVFLKAEEIDWIEAADYYARLHVAGSSHLIRESMNDLEAALDPDAFVRIHRSAIVNLDRVREMRPLFRGELVVILNDGTQLRMSRSRREELESRFRRRR